MTSHNVTSSIKLNLFIGNSNAKHSELHLKKMRIALLCLVITLGHIMLTTRIALCDVAIHLFVFPVFMSI